SNNPGTQHPRFSSFRFFFQSHPSHPDLHSFPTRRSSDLGDFNRKRVSAFTDRIGTRVASELCTVIDDGTLPGRRGSLNVDDHGRSEEHTSELQSRFDLVCRLLLEKKKKIIE